MSILAKTSRDDFPKKFKLLKNLLILDVSRQTVYNGKGQIEITTLPVPLDHPGNLPLIGYGEFDDATIFGMLSDVRITLLRNNTIAGIFLERAIQVEALQRTLFPQIIWLIAQENMVSNDWYEDIVEFWGDIWGHVYGPPRL